MKTYHVFIASSLSFQKERDLMEKVLTERNNSELNIVVHRHEKNGDNDLAKGDTQEIINSEIRQCDVIIFFAGNWIRSKTIGEFNVAIENASNKHIYFYQMQRMSFFVFFISNILSQKELLWELALMPLERPRLYR